MLLMMLMLMVAGLEERNDTAEFIHDGDSAIQEGNE